MGWVNLPKEWQESLCNQCKWFGDYPLNGQWYWDCDNPQHDYAKDISSPKPIDKECQGFEAKAKNRYREQVADLILKDPDGKDLVIVSNLNCPKPDVVWFLVGNDSPDGSRYKVEVTITEI